MTEKYNKIFASTDCISHENMQKYLAKELSKQELQVIEKHIVDCEMCNDELEGLKLLNKNYLSNIVTEINSKIDAKNYNKKNVFLDYRFQAIAASFLLIISISIFYLNRNINQTTKQEIAQITNQVEPKIENMDAPILAKNSIIYEEKNIEAKKETKKENQLLKKSKSIQTETNFDKSDTKTNVILDIPISDDSKDITTVETPNLLFDEKINSDSERESSAVAGYAIAKTPANEDLLKKEQNIKNETVTRQTTTFADKSANEEIMQLEMVSVSSKRTKPSKAKESAATQTTVSKSSENISDFDLGLNEFSKQDYEKSKEYFKKSISSGTQIYKSVYYCGLSYYNLTEYKIAQSYFEEIEHEKFNELYNETQWYLAQCYVKTNNISKAYLILNKISTSDSEYKHQAIELMKVLE
jgi:hypothetical protein